jgi:hypothetical protein
MIWRRFGTTAVYGDKVAAAVYGALALAVMGPALWRPGYIFLLDMVWTPKLAMPMEVDSSFLLNAGLHYLSLIVPSQIIQKLLLLGILFAAGFGAHRLAREWGRNGASTGGRLGGGRAQRLGDFAPYFAGVFYMINPFVYERLVTGQWMVLFGYALMPFFVAALWSFLEKPERSRAGWLVLWALAVSIVSVHSVFFMALVASVSLIAFSVAARRGRSTTRWVSRRKLLIWGGTVLAVWIVACSFWLLPMMSGQSAEAKLIGGFGSSNVRAFQTVGDPQYGVVFNAAALYGFWAEAGGRYASAKNGLDAWPLLAVTFMMLAAVGLAAARRRPEAWAMAAVGGLALLLGIGTAYGPLAGLYDWCVRNVPFFQGYREPQKFIGLLALADAYLGAVGVAWLSETLAIVSAGRVGKIISRVIALVLCALPLVYAHSMLWSCDGQLKSADYPADWYALNRRLNADTTRFDVLFLPWHQYQSFSFSGSVIATPAKYFFDKPVIQGDNAEFGNIDNPLTMTANPLVIDRPLESNIKYVVLAKVDDAAGYAWVGRRTDLILADSSPTLKLYINKEWRP